MKKRHLWLAAFMLLTMIGRAQNVAINADGSTPDPNAALDIKSTNKGVLIPRIGTAVRLGIPNTRGLLVYDTTTSSFWYNTGAGWQSLSPGRLDSTTRNTFLGYYSGNGRLPNIKDVDTDSAFYAANTAIGYASLSATTSGMWNVAAGMGSLYKNTTGTGNTGTGALALFQSNGMYNTATGLGAMKTNVSGSYNTATGVLALGYGSTGQYNTAVGHVAMMVNASGNGNTAIGAGTMGIFRSGNDNTVIGNEAGASLNGNNSNTIIGAYANVSVYPQELSNATAIGYSAIVNASNKIRLGNSAVTVIEGQVPFTTPSDGRFKFQVKEDVKGLDFILRLRPVTYRFDVSRFDAQGGNPKPTGNMSHLSHVIPAAYNEAALIRRSGFIAQEVEKAAKASGYDFSGIIVPKTEDEHYSLSYESFVVPLVKAVQEQQKTILTQHNTIEEQKKALEALQQAYAVQNTLLQALQQQLNELKKTLPEKH